MVKHFANLYYPGIICSDRRTLSVPDRDPLRLKSELESKGDSAYAFRFFDQTCATADGDECLGPRKNDSGCYFTRGVIKTRDQIIAQEGSSSVAARNCETNKIDKCVAVNGQLIQMNDGDVLLTP